LDLFSESFYINRKESIDKRIEQLKTMPIEKMLDMMEETWSSRPARKLLNLDIYHTIYLFMRSSMVPRSVPFRVRSQKLSNVSHWMGD
jgi:hypothetical protein